MKNDSKYLRVGTTYYKLIQRPQLSGGKTKTLTKWNRETIIHDHSRKFADGISKYDGFCCIPNHLSYQKTVENFYNIYNEIPQQPSVEIISKEEIPHTFPFLTHIFDEQLELGLDCLKILLENPTQILPILCLVSKERSTGKSTFLKWLKEIFGLNMTYIKGDSFNSKFNSDWASMLIIAIDEVFFDRKEITERLKTFPQPTRTSLKTREKTASWQELIVAEIADDDFLKYWMLKWSSLFIGRYDECIYDSDYKNRFTEYGAYCFSLDEIEYYFELMRLFEKYERFEPDFSTKEDYYNNYIGAKPKKL